MTVWHWKQFQFLESLKALLQEVFAIDAVMEAGLPRFDCTDEDWIDFLSTIRKSEVGESERLTDELMHVRRGREIEFAYDRCPCRRRR